jgi:hypothetical protein
MYHIGSFGPRTAQSQVATSDDLLSCTPVLLRRKRSPTEIPMLLTKVLLPVQLSETLVPPDIRTFLFFSSSNDRVFPVLLTSISKSEARIPGYLLACLNFVSSNINRPLFLNLKILID